MKRRAAGWWVLGMLAGFACWSVPAPGQEKKIPELPEAKVEGQPPAPEPTPPPLPETPRLVENSVAAPISASQGTIGSRDIELFPYLRPGEIFELIPGLIVTQHSGTGKANQWFLRGFNLDHGTDFSLWFDGIPLNLPTNGHGQGYLDVNFIIPEIIQSITFKKGVYYAEVGDFSSAGYAAVKTFNVLPQSIARLEYGMDNWNRVLLADSPQVGPGVLLYALECNFYDGPWVNPEDFQKYNGFLKYTIGDENHGIALSALAYSAKWNSTDQIPLRAVLDGRLPRLGTVDPTDGGESRRWGANLQYWNQQSEFSYTTANAFIMGYTLDLFSNFTYFLDNEIDGDQFLQYDRRVYGGLNIAHTIRTDGILNRPMSHTVGLQMRNDNIYSVGLRNTRAREIIGVTREDAVVEQSMGVYYNNEIQWFEKMRTVLGVRGDWYRFSVDAFTQPLNGGEDHDEITSPKASVIFGPWANTNVYVSGGFGFHSNDARGTTITVDPLDPTVPADRVPGLVRSRGAEVGVANNYFPNLLATAAVWYLELDSEILFVGDAGTTEASRPSERYGIELTSVFRINDYFTLDADWAATHARFADFSDDGDLIPGAPNVVADLGPTIRFPSGWFAGARLRYFGPRPLIEDGSVYSDSTSMVNAIFGYQGNRFRAALEFLNLFDTDDHDIDYFYASRLPGEPVDGIDDIHFHPVEPFTIRFYLDWSF